MPLQLLPDWARQLAAILPFQCTFAFPIEALIGDLPPTVLLGGLVMQGLWIIIGASLAQRTFRIAIKRYSRGGRLMRAFRLFWTFARVGCAQRAPVPRQPR